MNQAPRQPKDPADVCQALAHLGDDRRRAILCYWLLGDETGLTGAERLIIEWDRAQYEADLEQQRPYLQRAAIAFRLARDLDALRDLLAGVPVHPARLDQAALYEARQTTYVQLVAPISILDQQAAA